jgi:transcriptional regulator with XRE-family HTH domain
MTHERPGDSADIGDYSGLPGVHVTVDQIVARNVKLWRKLAGLTQGELGERIGWSAANVSAAELSAKDGKDRRRFDAHTLAAIAKALSVPIAALFLPPEDDGIACRYLIHADPGECSGMSELASLLISDPPDDDSPVSAAYRKRYAAVIAGYLDAERGEQLLEWSGGPGTPEEQAERLARLRWQREALAAMVGDIDAIVDAIADAGSSYGH